MDREEIKMNREEIKNQVRRYYNIWREMLVSYEEWAKQYGISYNCLLVLYSLWEDRDNCTQKEICSQWVLPKQTVNTILKELQKKGMIEFEVMEKDHRNKSIHLTDEGICFAEEIIPALQDLEVSVMEELGGECGKALIENTAMFAEYFKKGMEKGK